MSDDDFYDHPDDICRPGDGCDPAPPLSPREREIVDRFEAASDPFADDLPPEWLVAYAPCGCVRAIRILGYGKAGDDEFRAEFPACIEAAYWPRIKCPEHFPAVA